MDRSAWRQLARQTRALSSIKRPPSRDSSEKVKESPRAQQVMDPSKQSTKIRGGTDADRVVLQELMTSIQQLQSQLQEMDVLPPPWVEVPSIAKGNRDSRNILDKTRAVFERLLKSVQPRGPLLPWKAHRNEVTVILEQLLQIYSLIRVPDESVFDECTKILAAMKKWQLEVPPQHCNYSLTAAAREGRWEEASNLFLQQIRTSQCPYDMKVSYPIGLYVVAKHNQQQSGTTSPPVFAVLDAVTTMSMVSPNDQRQCKYAFPLWYDNVKGEQNVRF